RAGPPGGGRSEQGYGESGASACGRGQRAAPGARAAERAQGAAEARGARAAGGRAAGGPAPAVGGWPVDLVPAPSGPPPSVQKKKKIVHQEAMEKRSVDETENGDAFLDLKKSPHRYT
ncbi:hypothetical protein U0070_017588, partial [Myodes glareolus]